MFERFSEPARQAFVAAHAEARALGADRLGTGPVLLGLLHDDASIAARAFSSLGISSREIRRRLALGA
ncbi:MAG: Clp protease, partial [Actinobacteria bacterium]|nr:Clp protease [Actinomycetota bacterium]